MLNVLQVSIHFCQNSSWEEQQFSTVVMSWRLNALKICHILSKNVMSSVCTLNKPNFLLVTERHFTHFCRIPSYIVPCITFGSWLRAVDFKVRPSSSTSFETFERSVLFRPLLAIYTTSPSRRTIASWRKKKNQCCWCHHNIRKWRSTILPHPDKYHSDPPQLCTVAQKKSTLLLV